MASTNKFRLGIFVLAGVLLLMVFIVLLGMRGSFKTKGKLVTYVPDSVQGVNVGAPVKYKGVPVGSVDKMSIQIEDKMIRVEMSVDFSIFASSQPANLVNLNNFYSFMSKEVESGLRCTIEFAGITGMRYIEFNYAKENGEYYHPESQEKGILYIPSVSSKLTSIVQLINTSLDNLSKVNLEGISQKLEENLTAMRDILADQKLRNSIDKLEDFSINLSKASEEVVKVVTEERIKALMDNLANVIKSVDELTKSGKETLNDSKIPETTGALRQTSVSVMDMEEHLRVSLLKLNQAIDAITDLVSSIEEDPSSVIRGKQKQPIFKSK